MKKIYKEIEEIKEKIKKSNNINEQVELANKLIELKRKELGVK